MVNEYVSKVNGERVKERVDSYIVNKGYRIERMITCERFEISTPDDLPMGRLAQPALVFSVGMRANRILEELFAPIETVYSEGRNLFAKASVLTSKYTQLLEKDELVIQEIRKWKEDDARELSERLSKSGMFKKWLLHGKSKSSERFFQRIISYNSSHLPKPVPEKESISALNKLYEWLQTGEEDADSKRAADELVHPFDLLTEEQIRLLKIKKDLYKIKNHTAIVCLDQLKKDGLTLDTVIASEPDRIPQMYLADVPSYGKLRIGRKDSFGEGLFS